MVQLGSWPCKKMLFVPNAKDEEGRRCVCYIKLVMMIPRIIILCTVHTDIVLQQIINHIPVIEFLW